MHRMATRGLPVVDIDYRKLQIDCDLAEVVIIKLYVTGAPSWDDRISFLVAVECKYIAYHRRARSRAQGTSLAHPRPQGQCI